MAVLGIVFFYTKIYKLIYVKNRIIDFFWQITALSISVQLATFAISIHYFHHFPALFLITNLFAIPTAIIVVLGSLLIFTFSFIPFLSQMIGFALENWVNIYNDVMFYLSKFSVTSIEGVYLKGIYVYLIILVLFLFVRTIETRKIWIFKLFTYSLILVTIVVFVDHYRSAFQKKLIVYDVKDRIYTDVFIGNKCYSNVLLDSSDSDVDYNILPNRRYHLISEIRSMDDFHGSRSFKGNQLIMINNKSFLFLIKPQSLNINSDIIEIDYLILGSTAIKHLDKIANDFNAKNLIIHGNWKKFQLNDLKKSRWSESKFHVIEYDGAFSYSI
jgi:competence protein ComEC